MLLKPPRQGQFPPDYYCNTGHKFNNSGTAVRAVPDDASFPAPLRQDKVRISQKQHS